MIMMNKKNYGKKGADTCEKTLDNELIELR